MVKILLCGCQGRMGKVITEMAAQDENVQIAAGVDVAGGAAGAYPVYQDIFQCREEADVLVDFSSPAAFDKMLDYCLSRSLPAVVCTTGLDERQLARLEEASGKIAVLRSANMSLGINLLMKVLSQAAPVLSAAGFDVEIVEKHHNRKKDAPSGTALALAESINASLEEPYECVYDRSGRFEPRRPREIGISAVRGGTIVGEHEVIFAGTDEVITFQHTAYSRALFGRGALEGAKYLSGRAPGYYHMSDAIEMG